MRLARESTKKANVFESIIEAAVYLGDKIEYHILLGQEKLRINSPPSQVFKEGEKVYIYIEKCNALKQNA